MNFFKKALAFVMAFSILGFYFPKTSFAGQGYLFAKAAAATGITEHAPEVLAPPEEEIPVEEVAKKKRKTWYWVLGGALLVGAIAAAGGGGGGGGGDDTGAGETGGETGDVPVSW